MKRATVALVDALQRYPWLRRNMHTVFAIALVIFGWPMVWFFGVWAYLIFFASTFVFALIGIGISFSAAVSVIVFDELGVDDPFDPMEEDRP